MEQVVDNGNNELMWLGMVLGSLMVCPKLLSNLPSWEQDGKDWEARKNKNYE